MPNLLPTLFIVLGAFALVLTLYWLWQSLRGAFVHVDGLAGTVVTPGSKERASLVAEKNGLLVALKDLEAERDNGKLSEGDFKELNARYRARAREVLRALDAQLKPHRAEARALLSGAGAAAAAAESAPAEARSVGAGSAAVAVSAGASPSAPTAAAGSDRCVACGASNDSDAVFCKKCGMRLTAEAST